MMRLLLCLFMVFTCPVLKAQKVFTLQEYLAVVARYHPVARQAALGVDIAGTDILIARGAFDPAIGTEIARKEFGGLTYYNYNFNELRIPTWYGIDVVAGIETLNGQRTDPTATRGRSSYVGVSMPVVKGLLFDKRRAALQQARVFQQLSVQEQNTVLNNLLYDAAKAYWSWWEIYQLNNLFAQAINNAEQRLRLVRQAFQLGDRPAIDTTEALAQLQSFQTRQAEITADQTINQLELGVFLWQDNGTAYALPEDVIPQPATIDFSLDLQQLLAQVPVHPELQQYRFKLDALNIDRRLYFQSLLPEVYVKYNQLTPGHNLLDVPKQPFLRNNYQYGVSINMPLRLSEGRGLVRQARLKINQTELARLNKEVELQTKVRQYHNQWTQLIQQVRLQQAAINSFATLQRGEEIRFANGESSLFLINARELKTLEAREKLIFLQSKLQKAGASAVWASGTFASVQR